MGRRGVLKFFVSSLMLFALNSWAAAPAASADAGISNDGTVEKCGASQARGQDYQWCISAPNTNEATDVIVYFHGAGGDEHQWRNSEFSRVIAATWQRLGIKRPSVLSVSFGPHWLVLDSRKPRVPVSRELLANRIIPAIERELPHRVSSRTLVGVSMGGFNATQMLAKHQNMFSRVALLCPAISTIHPHSSQAEIDAYIDRHRPYINEHLVYQLLETTRYVFPTPEEYRPHNPILLANTLKGTSPKVFVSVSDRDEFGFFEGAGEFARIGAARGAQVTWVPIYGYGHCAQTPESLDLLARFLVDRL